MSYNTVKTKKIVVDSEADCASASIGGCVCYTPVKEKEIEAKLGFIQSDVQTFQEEPEPDKYGWLKTVPEPTLEELQASEKELRDRGLM